LATFASACGNAPCESESGSIEDIASDLAPLVKNGIRSSCDLRENYFPGTCGFPATALK
jgi:hypothetical protein